MIGIIITGHGYFASGLLSSLELIMGKQERLAAVDFDGNGTENYEKALNKAISSMKDSREILICTDLLGGTPFKTAALLSEQEHQFGIVAGTNLPMLMEVLFARNGIEKADLLASQAVSAGKENIMKYVPAVSDDTAESEEGI